eukprot:3562256-Pyramimonas_sp.AAC.1
MLFDGSGRPLAPTRPSPTLLAAMGGNATPIIDEEQFFGAGGSWVENLHAALVERNERVAQELTPELTSVLTRAANPRAHLKKIKGKLGVSELTPELNSVLTRAANPRAHRKKIKGKLGVSAAARIYGPVAEREKLDSYDSGPQTKRRLEG